MRFTAAQENQQAGLLIWQDDDHYIQLGRRFLGRNQIAFTLEEGPGGGEQSVRYDAEGQSGKPVWLIVRKEKIVIGASSVLTACTGMTRGRRFRRSVRL